MTSTVKWDMHRIPDEYNEDGSQKAVLTIILKDATVINVPTTAHHYKDVLKSITDAELNGEELDEQKIREFASITFSAGKQLRNLSSRVQFDGNDTILYDGDPVDGSIGETLLALAKAGKPVDSLVNFLDKISQNPSENSRKQFYDFVTRHKLTLTPDGDVIFYKGVKIGEDGTPLSIRSGPGIVDGVTFTNSHLPNYPGAIVTIPRSYVNADQFVGCAAGLHVGAFDYAMGWAQGMTLTCKVNPRDVVSVPECSSYQKVRVCRYEVLTSTEVKWVGPLYGSESSDGWDDEDSEDYYEGEYLPDWEDSGIDAEDAIDYIDQGYSLREVLENREDDFAGNGEDDYEDEESDQVVGQTAFSFDGLEDKPAVKTATEIREEQDEIVEAVGNKLKVRRLKVKENSDGTLRRATLILKGDKGETKNRLHLYFNEDGSFKATVEDKSESKNDLHLSFKADKS
jgi:hypothetical protein